VQLTTRKVRGQLDNVLSPRLRDWLSLRLKPPWSNYADAGRQSRLRGHNEHRRLVRADAGRRLVACVDVRWTSAETRWSLGFRTESDWGVVRLAQEWFVINKGLIVSGEYYPHICSILSRPMRGLLLRSTSRMQRNVNFRDLFTWVTDDQLWRSSEKPHCRKSRDLV
jgi:hypothetical protein